MYQIKNLIATSLVTKEWIELDRDAAAKLILDCAKKLGLDFGDSKVSIHRWRYASGHRSFLVWKQ